MERAASTPVTSNRVLRNRLSKSTLSPTTHAAERAVLVFVNPESDDDEYVEEELLGLCEAAQVEPVAELRQRLDEPVRATFLGKGKMDELAALARETDADIVLVDGELSGGQQRNLEETVGRRVVDRRQLFFDTFRRHPKTKEGMRQGELAQHHDIRPKPRWYSSNFASEKG